MAKQLKSQQSYVTNRALVFVLHSIILEVSDTFYKKLYLVSDTKYNTKKL